MWAGLRGREGRACACGRASEQDQRSAHARARAPASPSCSASCGLALGEAGHPGFLCRGFCLRGSQLIRGPQAGRTGKVRRRSRALSKQAGGHAPRSRCPGTFSQRAEEGIGVGRPGSLSLVGLTARGQPPPPLRRKADLLGRPRDPGSRFFPRVPSCRGPRSRGVHPYPVHSGFCPAVSLGPRGCPGRSCCGSLFWGARPWPVGSLWSPGTIKVHVHSAGHGEGSPRCMSLVLRG